MHFAWEADLFTLRTRCDGYLVIMSCYATLSESQYSFLTIHADTSLWLGVEGEWRHEHAWFVPRGETLARIKS